MCLGSARYAAWPALDGRGGFVPASLYRGLARSEGVPRPLGSVDTAARGGLKTRTNVKSAPARPRPRVPFACVTAHLP